MECFYILFRGSVNIHKKNKPSKLFIFALESLHLYETYQDCFMLNVGTHSIFAGQVQEKNHKKQIYTSIKHFIIHRQKKLSKVLPANCLKKHSTKTVNFLQSKVRN